MPLSHDVCFKNPPFGFIFLLCIFNNLSCDINLTFSQSQNLGSDILFTFENNLARPHYFFIFFLLPHTIITISFSLQRTWILFNLFSFT